jgi:hypothetical protein
MANKKVCALSSKGSRFTHLPLGHSFSRRLETTSTREAAGKEKEVRAIFLEPMLVMSLQSESTQSVSIDSHEKEGALKKARSSQITFGNSKLSASL